MQEESDEDEGSQDHYAGGAALPSKKRGAPSDAGAGSSKGACSSTPDSAYIWSLQSHLIPCDGG